MIDLNQLLATFVRIEAIFFDCDGVLTPGDLYYDESGKRTLRFNSKDGYGLATAARAGIKLGVISGRASDIAEHRCKELGFEVFIGRCKDKGAALVQICAEWGIQPENAAFVGDDIPDMGAFRVAGLKIAVADSAPEMLAAADWVTKAPGGHGAAREVCEAILKAKGRWVF